MPTIGLLRIILLFVLVAAGVGCAARRDLWTKEGGLVLVYEVDVAHPFGGAPRARAEILRRTAATVEQRLSWLARGGRVRVEGNRLVVEIPRAAADAETVARIKRRLPEPARLEFKLVDSGSERMRAIAKWVTEANSAQWPDVRVQLDRWTSPVNSADAVVDWFLTAPERSSLERVFAALPPALAIPADREIACERISSRDPEGTPAETMWRTHYLERRAEITNGDIADAEAVVSTVMMQQSEIRVTLTPEAGRAFESLTARAVGRKLAILLDGEVESAPLVMSRIAGGQIRITLGSGPSASVEQEAVELAAALRTGALEAPLRLLKEDIFAPR